jgi:hypothetical protein
VVAASARSASAGSLADQLTIRSASGSQTIPRASFISDKLSGSNVVTPSLGLNYNVSLTRDSAQRRRQAPPSRRAGDQSSACRLAQMAGVVALGADTVGEQIARFGAQRGTERVDIGLLNPKDLETVAPVCSALGGSQ